MEQPAPERQWAEHEKVRGVVQVQSFFWLSLLLISQQVYLLAEILKAAPISSHVLFGFIRDSQIQVRWNDMALPPGTCMRLGRLIWTSISVDDHVLQLDSSANPSSCRRSFTPFMPTSIQRHRRYDRLWPSPSTKSQYVSRARPCQETSSPARSCSNWSPPTTSPTAPIR
jgi:hypothetical protein